MKFERLVNVSQQIRATSKKKEKIFLIADLLKQIRGKEAYLAAHYLSGNLPSGKLGVGWQTVQNAIVDFSPTASTLEIVNVQAYLEDISKASGSGSVEKKINLLRELLSKTGENERRFLMGLLMGEIRQGALEGLVLEAVAIASSVPLKSVRRENMFAGNVGEVAEAALEKGSAGLERFGPRLFHPISPMLANRIHFRLPCAASAEFRRSNICKRRYRYLHTFLICFTWMDSHCLMIPFRDAFAI